MRTAALGALFLLAFVAARAEAWDSSAADKLSIGQTTPDEAEALLGKPDYRRWLLFNRDTERWDYQSVSRVGLPGKTLVLDFVGGRLLRRKIAPDAVDDRRGFVLDFGFGGASARTTGSRRVKTGETAFAFSAGWAPTDRCAVLFDGIGGAAANKAGQAGAGVGLRVFPIMPWYLQADYLLTTEDVYSPLKNYTVSGRGFAVRTGYELSFSRWGALAPELFLMRTHSWAPDSAAPVGTVEDLRSTVWGALVKFVWYP